MLRTKQTARKHMDGEANLGKKTRLRRAVGADTRWGTAKQTFVQPIAGTLPTHRNDPNQLDYRCKYKYTLDSTQVVSVKSSLLCVQGSKLYVSKADVMYSKVHCV